MEDCDTESFDMASQSGRLLKFLTMVGKLKHIKRTGWLMRGVKEPESIAGHMYRMAIMSFVLDGNNGINKDKCMKISLVHDMAECIVGDLTPSDGVPKAEKHKREKRAMERLVELLGEEQGKEMYCLWQEYETQSSEESKIVKDFDKFDMILQAYEYERTDNRPRELQEFFDSTQGKFQSSIVKRWVEELNQARQNHLLSKQS